MVVVALTNRQPQRGAFVESFLHFLLVALYPQLASDELEPVAAGRDPLLFTSEQ